MFRISIVILPILVFAHCNLSQKSDKSLKSKENTNILSSDTILVYHINNIPVINGDASDAAWEQTGWHPINQVWIPYGATIDSTVFYGRYKLVWSKKENLLYILAEITDKVFVGGHQYHSDPAIGGGYADHDILEIFIDEDKSGGLHVFDGTGPVAEQWGSNAENAFAYHITIETPADGETITQKRALDIAGNSWSDYYIADFKDHLPQFAVKRNGNHYTWEFSLRVFNDTYDHNQPQLALETLFAGKVLGFSVAYCNNDNPVEDPKQRDHFFGSAWVPEENYNDHWKDASFFGTIKLVK